MSGSEEYKKRLNETFGGSPMPDFEKQREVVPSPLIAESKISSTNTTKDDIPCFANCNGQHAGLCLSANGICKRRKLS